MLTLMLVGGTQQEHECLLQSPPFGLHFIFSFLSNSFLIIRKKGFLNIRAKVFERVFVGRRQARWWACAESDNNGANVM